MPYILGDVTLFAKIGALGVKRNTAVLCSTLIISMPPCNNGDSRYIIISASFELYTAEGIIVQNETTEG